MDKMKLLFVLSDFGYGGPTKSLLGLLERIDFQLFDVAVVTLSDIGDLRQFVTEEVKVLPTPADAAALALRPQTVFRNLSQSLRRPRLLFASVRALVRHRLRGGNMNLERQRLWLEFGPELKPLEDRFDVAVAFGGGFTHYYTHFCVDATKKYHSVISDYEIIGLDRVGELECFNGFDGALAVSEETARIFNDAFPGSESRTRVLGNYVPEDLYGRMPSDREILSVSQPGRFRVVTISRLDRLKGVELAVEACADVAGAGVPIDWFVLGDGPERERLEHLARKFGIETHLHFAGYVDNPYSVMEECDAMVHPSYSEGRSVAVDEAQFLGIPVIAAAYPTVRGQVEDGVNGLVVPHDAGRIAEEVVRLFNDADLRGRLASNSRGHSPADANGDLSDYLFSLR